MKEGGNVEKENKNQIHQERNYEGKKERKGMLKGRKEDWKKEVNERRSQGRVMLEMKE